MESVTYPVGSVVKADDTTYLIVGIKFYDQDNRFVKHYMIVPFPAGQFDSQSLRAVKADDVELIREGYRNDKSDAFLNYYNMIDNLSRENDSATLYQAFQDAEKMMEKL